MEPLSDPVRNKSLIPEYVWLQSQLGPDLIPGHHLEAITWQYDRPGPTSRQAGFPQAIGDSMAQVWPH